MTLHTTQKNGSALSARVPKIAVIQANWHLDIVGQATEAFTAHLGKNGISADQVSVFDVPGSLEIPLMAQKLAKTGEFDLIAGMGLIVDGGIYRHDFVAATVLKGMMRVQLDTEVPVLSVVLTPHNFQEVPAHMDFYKQHFVHKGQEAASAALQTLANMDIFTQSARLAS